MIKKAVIPCGGLGTRFLPITKAVAKEMLPIIDRPVLDFIVDEAVAAGVTDILIIISPNKEIIREYYREDKALEGHLTASGKQDIADIISNISSRANINFVVQYTAKGSGDALLLAESFAADEPFALLLGDDVIYNQSEPVIGQLMQAYNEHGKTILGVQRRQLPEILKYGVIDIKQELSTSIYDMNGILEKPTEQELTSDLCTLGRYIVTPQIFDILKRTPIGKNGELQLTDGLNIMAREYGAYAYVFRGERYDMGDKLGSLMALTEFGLRDELLGESYKEYLLQLVKTLND